jgi:hypothetical protein
MIHEDEGIPHETAEQITDIVRFWEVCDIILSVIQYICSLGADVSCAISTKLLINEVQWNSEGKATLVKCPMDFRKSAGKSGHDIWTVGMRPETHPEHRN